MSLTDTLVGSLLAGLVLAGAADVLAGGLGLWRRTEARVAALGPARMAALRMARELREAGYDPAGADLAPLTEAGPQSLILQRDLDGDGVASEPSSCPGPTQPSEVVGFRLSGGRLLRSPQPSDPACNDVLAEHVAALALEYADDAGTPTTDPARVRAVTIRLTVTDAARLERIVLTEQAHLRNAR